MDARMILVEGFPGCGKSTTAQWLARQLRSPSAQAEWYYEDQRPHPLAGEGPYASWPDYFSQRLGRWGRLAREAASSGRVQILESAWLQVPLCLMLRQDLDPGVIRAFIDRAVEAMSPAAPALIYLSQPSPESGMQALMQRRGMPWTLAQVSRSDATRYCKNRGRSGIDGVLRYWAEHNRLAEAIVHDAAMPKLVLRADDGDWLTRRAAILRFLALDGDARRAPAPAEGAARLVGTYRQGTSTLTIELDGRDLVVRRLLWPRDRLLAVSSHVYEIESWPVVLTFIETDGVIGAVRIEAPVLAGRRLDGVYERVS
jgi:hypothetical protein